MSDQLQTLRNFVDGGWVDSVSGATYELIDPVTGQPYASAPLSGPEDVDRAMQAASRAFEGWRDSTPSEQPSTKRRRSRFA